MADLGIPGVEDAVEAGRGGFAIVYRARQPAFNREVAVKVITAQVDDTTRARFEREVSVLGALGEHPGIVALYDAGTTPDGRPYLMMPFLSGGSLKDLLDGGMTMSPREVAETVTRLGGALQAAHDEGVLHRDIKPANVLLGRFGDPMLADFGIARIAGGHETTSGVITASVAHAAPEILDGHPPSVASDVYSLTSTAYSLLAGKPAFTSTTDQSMVPLISRTLTAPVPDIDGVDQKVMTVLRNGMAKDPAERYGSAAELASAFADAVAGRIPPRPPLPDRSAATSSATARVDGPPTAPGAAGPVSGPTPTHTAGGDDPTSPVPKIIGGVVAAALVLAIGVALTSGGDDPAPEPTPVATAEDDGGAPGSDVGSEPADATGAPADPAPADAIVAADPGPLAPGPPADDPTLNGGLDPALARELLAAPDEGAITPGEDLIINLAPLEFARFTFPVPGGNIVHARTIGDAIDTALVLGNAGSLFIRSDDDSGGGANGTNARIDVLVPRSGPHSIALTTFEETTAGDTTLILRVGAPTRLVPDGPARGTLLDQTDVAFFTLPAGGPDDATELQVMSSDGDLDVRVVDDRGREVAFVTGEPDVRIDLTNLRPRSYTVIVGTPDADGATFDVLSRLES